MLWQKDNMQKVCLFLASSLLIFLTSFNISFAKEHTTEDSTASDSAQKVTYELPYPGLLPDSPIYFLRIIRDRVVDFLISDSLKKSEFDLLQADKRLNAGIYLFNKGKLPMSISTISKAENYFMEALQKIKEAKRQGMETTETTNRLINSSKKHLEVLKSLKAKSPKNFKSSFDRELQRVDKFVEEAIALILK